ncbi:3-oxoacyl-[acyl-carrier-protein] reductase FabG [Mycena venus]|uniref:3-oxoacyl-[acyl-carrier-protein] reductase FabG n=1 Tax=Mycena venus TaxID=2733690 RepID=A0A8H6XH96_9AGAR|nr:3-oxoacyl-[acyl-carrier-protein] reductase FabG [Mycena venus]
MSDRLAQVSQHLSNAHGRGLLAGEVAIITGAGQGIGRSTALLFAKEGAKVVISDIDVKRLETVGGEIKAAGGDFLAVAGDVGADDFPKKIVDATVEKYGKINHIVNNAGFTFDKMLHTTPDETFDIIIKIHVRAPFRLIRQAAPYFRLKPDARENRSIINVSSTSGLHGNVGQAKLRRRESRRRRPHQDHREGVGPVRRAREYDCVWVDSYEVPFLPSFNPYSFLPPAFPYSPSFFIPFTAPPATAKEAGVTIDIDGKKVALGVPGATPESRKDGSLPHIPLNRGGTPDEAAGAMLFLASPLASYVSGHTLEVTGGTGI